MNKELHISFGTNTDTGLAKEFNSDSVLEFKILNGNVFAVCDGHDGAEGHGALAAKMVAESIKKYFYNKSYADLSKALTNAITYANVALYELSKKDKKYEGIGSTLAIVIYREGKLFYAYAGDSRIYAYRDQKLSPLTRDHVENPTNPKDEEVKVLLGKSKDIKFGVSKNPLQVEPGDVFMLCTDGLTDQVSEEEIQDVISDSDMAPEHKSRNLIELAKEKGGEDCATVHVLEFEIPVEPVKHKKQFNLKPLLIVLAAIIGVGAVSFGGYKLIEFLNNKPKKEVVVEMPAVDQEEHTSKTATKEEKPTVIESENIIAEEEDEPIINEPVKSAVESGPVYHMHKVVYGENLFRLGLRYNITQQKLVDINGSKATNLVAGAVLKIPVKAVHTVKKGESFSVVSDKYNVKIKEICQASKISESTSLKEGQVLIIPLAK